jgi:adenylate cyclase
MDRLRGRQGLMGYDGDMTSLDVPLLRDWLLRAPHVDDGGVALMTGLVTQVRALGLPLWRCSFTLMTKHPELVWRTVQWKEDSGVQIIDRRRSVLDEPYFTRSPIALLRRGAPPIRVRLLPGEALPFPICEDLRAKGGTDYFAQGLPASNGETGYVSWASCAPDGFSDESVAALTALTPELGQRIELASAYHATRALLQVYLGRNAGARVVEGSFQRGGGELIDAAIWFCDLRGFTSLSDERPPEEVVKTLDDYFDRVAGAVMMHEGEVLKFIGDAILAIFPVAGDAPAACRNALAAADSALAALARLNDERAAAGTGPLAIGIALHLGQVMYGNIGARDRLDFTVISSSVNEASRLEGLCKSLATPLTLSEAFVKAAMPEGIVDLGHHTLKGVRAPIHVFTLDRLRASGK